VAVAVASAIATATMAVSCPEVMYGAYYPYLYGRAGPSRSFYQYERVSTAAARPFSRMVTTHHPPPVGRVLGQIWGPLFFKVRKGTILCIF